MTKSPINREVALAGQQVRRKVIFALTLCSVIPLLLLTYAFHAPVREFLGPIVGLRDSVSIPALLAFTALLMAGGAFIVWDIATALSRAAQLSNEQSPELPAEPTRKDEIGTLMSSFARMLATIEQQSQEINEFPRRLDQLIREAFRDSLTGLPNRALFMDRLTHALTRAERGGTNLAVLFLDLDRFKILNDTLGQEVGDRLLVEVGHRLAGCLSPEDTVARLGGDEFALLLEDASDLRGATALAEKVSAEIQRPFVVDGRDVLISASIGVALTGGGSMQPEEVLHNADLAMYQAKAEGRARVRALRARAQRLHPRAAGPPGRPPHRGRAPGARACASSRWSRWAPCARSRSRPSSAGIIAGAGRCSPPTSSASPRRPA